MESFSSDISNFLTEVWWLTPYEHGMKVFSPGWASTPSPGGPSHMSSPLKRLKIHFRLHIIVKNKDSFVHWHTS